MNTNQPPEPLEDEVHAWLRANWNACSYDDMPYAMACHWAEWGWRQAQQQLAEQVLKDSAGFILAELCAARQLALRRGQDPDTMTLPYLNALRRHYMATALPLPEEEAESADA
jgi:hypothetical protein